MGKKEIDSEIHHWTARKMSPKIILYVGLIFIIFIIISYFGFHSLSAVKALSFAAIGGIASLLPQVFTRIEYKLSQQKLESRNITSNKTEQKPYRVVFLIDQISYLVKIDNGLKYYLPLNEKNPLKRFWKKHISDKYSGEIKLEKKDRERILSFFEQNGILVR